jgi:hypothetical protein
MKARHLLPLAGALALCAWVALRGGAGELERGGTSPDADRPPGADRATAGPVPAAASGDGESELAAGEADGERAPAARTRELDAARFRIVGRVLVPPGAPHDETLVVAAFDKEPQGPGELRPARGVRLDPAKFVRAPIAAAPVDVAGDGAFTLELPSALRELWLDVDGRMLSLAHPVRVPLPLERAAGEILLRPELGAWIHGTVAGAGAGTPVLLGIDPRGIGTSERFLTSTLGSGTRAVLTDENGAFELRGAAAGMPWQAAARPAGLGLSSSASKPSRAGAELVLDLAAVPAATLAGRVVAPRGPGEPERGVASAEVFALPEGGQRLGMLWDLAPACVSDGDGRFELAGVGLGKQRVTALAGACESEALALDVAGDAADLRFELDLGASITGRVLAPDGAPAHADVTLRGERFRQVTATDADGRFRFGCLRPDARGTVIATRETHGGPQQSAAAEAKVGDDVELVLAERTPSAAAPSTGPIVRVVDPDGRPVADAEVELDTSEAFRTYHAWGQGRRARTDALGLCDVGRFYAVDTCAVATATGFAPSEITPLPAPAERVDVALRAGGALYGTVYDDRGVPQVRFTVLAVHQGSNHWFLAGTDESGSYRFDALPPGLHLLTARPIPDVFSGPPDRDEQERRARKGTAEVVVGLETRADLGAPPAAPVRVFGEVRSGGEPALAVVWFLADGEAPALAQRDIPTDERGRYEAALSPGRHRMLVAPAASGVLQVSTVDVPIAGAHRIDVDLPGGRIVGRVQHADGPAPALRVLAFRVDAPLGVAWIGGARTSDEGAFALEGLPAGRYQVCGRDRRLGVRPAFVELGADETGEVELRAETSGGLRIELRDADGSEIDGFRASVAAIDEAGARFDVNLGREVSNGGFAYPEAMPPGSYVFFASAPRLAAAPSGPHAVVAGETTDVVIELKPAATLLVEVVGRDGEPVDARLVVRMDDRAFPGDPASRSPLLGTEPLNLRAHRVGPLPPGRYDVSATAADGRSASSTVSVNAGEERELSLRLRD